ncbi:MAG: 4Fe-4S dicluster domain-containing protein [Clostridia bacterium]|nr:4Fe-4S dicluster domain-containing protein [Clostridia bacterium]
MTQTNRKIDVICFSGTGNTRLVIDKITSILRENNMEVCMKSEREPYTHEKGRELLLAFPINSQSVSPYIWKYINSLPDGNQDPIHVVLTMNESASIIWPLKKVLEKKNYQPKGIIEISMPNNMLLGSDTTSERMPAAISKAEQFAQDFINQKEVWEEHLKGSAFVSFLSRDTVLPWVTMRMFNKLIADPAKCTKCGLCVKECPVNNIRMDEFPVHLNHCDFCMHCGAVCKNDAVTVKGRPSCHIRSAKDI